MTNEGGRITPSCLPGSLRQGPQHGGGDLVDGDFFHATEIDGAFTEEAGAAFDVAADDGVAGSPRTCEAGLGAAEDGDHGNA